MPNFRLEKLEIPPESTQNTLMATDVPNGYWRIVCDQIADNQPSWELIMAVNQMEIEPITLSTSKGIVFVGAESGLFCIREQTGEIIFSINDLTFVQSMEMLSNERVLISAEDELLLFSSEGHLKWRVNLPDIVVDITEVSNDIEVELDSGEKLYIITETGLQSTRL